MAGLQNIPVLQMRYNTEQYDFRGNVENILGLDLERLHCSIGKIALLRRETDQATIAHEKFYRNFDGVRDTYQRFIRGMVRPLFRQPIVYQAVPTFRVHLPDNVAVGEYHKDSDYKHNPEAVTFWLPVTDAKDSNSVYIEMDGRPRPTTVPYGNVLIFDSVNMVHGNEVNTTDQTRVSMDFRVIPEDKFEPTGSTTINTHLPMDIGGYYDLCE